MPSAPETRPQTQSPASPEGQSSAGTNQITPELVNQLADKVMKMMMEELILENERSGSARPVFYHGKR